MPNFDLFNPAGEAQPSINAALDSLNRSADRNLQAISLQMQATAAKEGIKLEKQLASDSGKLQKDLLAEKGKQFGKLNQANIDQEQLRQDAALERTELGCQHDERMFQLKEEAARASQERVLGREVLMTEGLIAGLLGP